MSWVSLLLSTIKVVGAVYLLRFAWGTFRHLPGKWLSRSLAAVVSLPAMFLLFHAGFELQGEKVPHWVVEVFQTGLSVFAVVLWHSTIGILGRGAEEIVEDVDSTTSL